MINCGYSQTTLPQVISWQGQIGLFITPEQAKVINLDRLSLQECREHCDSLKPLLDSIPVLVSIYEHRLNNKDSIIKIRERSIDLRDSAIGVQALSLAQKSQQLDKVTKGRNTWKLLGLSGWGTIIIAGLILLL